MPMTPNLRTPEQLAQDLANHEQLVADNRLRFNMEQRARLRAEKKLAEQTEALRARTAQRQALGVERPFARWTGTVRYR